MLVALPSELIISLLRAAGTFPSEPEVPLSLSPYFLPNSSERAAAARTACAAAARRLPPSRAANPAAVVPAGDPDLLVVELSTALMAMHALARWADAPLKRGLSETFLERPALLRARLERFREPDGF